MDFQTKTRTITLANANSIMMQARLAVIFVHFTLALGALGDDLDAVLDMTIVYPDGIPTYQDLWQGNIKRIGVDIQKITLPDDLLQRLMDGKYQQDEQTKIDMYHWLDALWQQKDQRIQAMLDDFTRHP